MDHTKTLGIITPANIEVNSVIDINSAIPAVLLSVSLPYCHSRILLVIPSMLKSKSLFQQRVKVVVL